MTDQTNERTTVRDDFEAWTRGDVLRARTHLVDDLSFQGPIARCVATLAGFASMLARVELAQALYADGEATLLCDCVTASRAGTIRTAEFSGGAGTGSPPSVWCSTLRNCAS